MGNFQTTNDHKMGLVLPENRIRQLAIELVLQAYNTDIPESKFSEYAKIIDHYVFDKNEDDYINKMVEISLHLSQRTYTGFYSISFNRSARNMTNDFFSIQDYFPELCNKNLTPLEKDKLQQQHIRELNALRNAFQKAASVTSGVNEVNEMNEVKEVPKFFRQCEESSMEDIEVDDLYSQCYNQNCVIENLKTQPLDEVNKPTYSSPISNQIFVDDSRHMYCLPTKDLLLAIIKDQKNPLTNVSLSFATINRVKNNFSTELKLIEENIPEYFLIK